MTLSGTRQGKLTLYTYDGYPFSVIGPVTYLWQARQCHSGNEDPDRDSALWICCHPSFYAQALEEINKCFSKSPNLGTSSTQGNSSKTCDSEISVISLKDELVKFRLYGPASNLVLAEVLHLADIENKDARGVSNKENKEVLFSGSKSSSTADPEKGKQDGNLSPTPTDMEGSVAKAGCWWKDFYSPRASRSYFQEQIDCWAQIRKCYSPAEAPSNCLLALTVQDPRLLLPPKKSKVCDVNRGE